MDKRRVISRLVLLDTSEYRHRTFRNSGKYKHEPPKFQLELMSIYEKLSDEDLERLLLLKTK